MLPILVTSSSLSSPDPTYPVSCKPSFLLFSLSYLSLLFSLPSLPYFLPYFILFPYPRLILPILYPANPLSYFFPYPIYPCYFLFLPYPIFFFTLSSFLILPILSSVPIFSCFLSLLIPAYPCPIFQSCLPTVKASTRSAPSLNILAQTAKGQSAHSVHGSSHPQARSQSQAPLLRTPSRAVA